MIDLLSRKYYQLIADVIKKVTNEEGFINASELVKELSYEFTYDNHRFDKWRFGKACGVVKE